MKLSRWIVSAAAVTTVLSGCTDPVSPADNFPSFYGTWAGKTWTGQASATLFRGGAAGDTLYIEASRPVNSRLTPSETIIAKVIIHGIGTYLLGPGDASFNELIGGDVLAASYATTPTAVGRVIITSYSGAHGTVEGTIEFDAETTSPYGSYGSKASLRDAFFTAQVRTIPQS